MAERTEADSDRARPGSAASPLRPVALLSYHFPPMGSPGSLRIASFARGLAKHGWQPHVFTADEIGFPRIDPSLLQRLPDDLCITRRYGSQVAGYWEMRRTANEDGARRFRQLWLRARNRFGSLPDHATAWHLLMGLFVGRALRRRGIDVLVVSSPPASAMLAGALAARISGARWVVDLRDPPESGTSREERGLRRLSRRYCGRLLGRSDGVLANTPAAGRELLDVFPDLPVELLPNGYDAEAVAAARRPRARSGDETTRTIVHAGALYRESRDIGPFLEAMRRAQARLGDRIRLRLQLPGARPSMLAAGDRPEGGESAAIDLPGFLSHADALARLAAADLLLLIQGAGFETQIPSKAFEYLALGRPILALVAPGATAELMASTPQARVQAPDDVEGLAQWLVDWAEGRVALSAEAELPAMVRSREQATERLAQILDRWFPDPGQGAG